MTYRDEPETWTQIGYTGSWSVCECEMCTADPAVETELTVEDTE